MIFKSLLPTAPPFRNSLIIVCCFFATITYGQERKLRNYQDFHAPGQETKCINYFNDTASGVNNVNAFILAKMTELMYLERLDYQMRYFENHCQPVDTLTSTDWLCTNPSVTDENFEAVFKKRFQHYFDGPFESEEEHEEHEDDLDAKDHIRFHYIQKKHTTFHRFLGIKYQSSLDPELMVISTPKLILILFRGTDNVGDSEWGEWFGTNLRITQTEAGGALVGTKVHTGFWLSFDLIRDELIGILAKFDAKNKKIWLAGHSLGGALSIVTGVYLKSAGLDVQNVYTFASPRVVGNKTFIKKASTLLPNRIQRFEYFQDPVTLLWAPGFGYDYVGQRNWFDSEEAGNYKLYPNTHERVVVSGPLGNYPNIDTSGLELKEARRIKRNQMNGTIFWGAGSLHYHNPQWYVKATYQQLTEEEKKYLPKVDDSYPYLYFNRKNTK